MTTPTIYQIIAPLSDEQRIEARERAASIVLKSVGDKPDRKSYLNTSVSKYPVWFTRMIAGLMVIVFVAAAMPSLFRLFSAGRDSYLESMKGNEQSPFIYSPAVSPEPSTDIRVQAAIVGVSTFLLSEFLIVLSTIAARVYFTGRARLIFIIPVVMGLLMALVGNWTMVQPNNLFSWLETIIPVLTVLFVALIGERLTLESLETLHANEHAYQEALQSWQIASSTPDAHPRFMPALANALRDALKATNAQGAGSGQRKALMDAFTVEHWKPLVWRELQSDQWYAVDTGAPAELPALPELPEPAAIQRRKHSNASVLPEQQQTTSAPVEAVVIEQRPFGTTALEQDAKIASPVDHANIQMIEPQIVSVNGAGMNGNGHHS